MRKYLTPIAALLASGFAAATASAQEIILFDGPNFNGQQVRQDFMTIRLQKQPDLMMEIVVIYLVLIVEQLQMKM